MAERNILLRGQEPVAVIENEVVFLDSVQEAHRLVSDSPMRMDLNAIVHCRQGRILMEVGGNQEVKLREGQLLLIPAQKLLQTMMVSTDVEAGVLLVSDRVLKQVLGPQIDVWNRAMYLNETYVIDTRRWSSALHTQAQAVFKGDSLRLFKEFVFAFLRIFLLIICEELLRKEQHPVPHRTDSCPDASTDRERMIFNRFLDLLQHEQQKRRQVNYYAERICITPKYLSTVCRNVSGRSPMRWITDSVMEDCYQLLRTTDLTVKEISNQLGFPNSSFFGQYFREQAGMTPIEYRTKHII